jgi:hypothetical protein
MNWLSAFDIIPLVVIVLCAIEQLRLADWRKHPLATLLLVFLAVFAFHLIAQNLRGAATQAWQLLLDWGLAMLFGYQTLTFNQRDIDELGDSDHRPAQSR